MINAVVVGLGRWGRDLVECTQGKTYFGTFIATAEGWRMRESIG